MNKSGHILTVPVLGIAKPEPRPRARTLDGGKARVYVPSSAKSWKHSVRAATLAAIDRCGAADELPLPVDTPLRVRLDFRLKRPKAHRGATGLKPWAVVKHHTGTPDVDNLAKAALDAIGEWDGLPPLVWTNDSQVVELTVSKNYTATLERPGAMLEIYAARAPLDVVALDPIVTRVRQRLPIEPAVSLNEALAVERVDAGLARADFADWFGVPGSRVAAWERGERVEDVPETPLAGAESLPSGFWCLVSRLRSGLSQGDVARLSGIAVSWIKDTEKCLTADATALVRWWTNRS